MPTSFTGDETTNMNMPSIVPGSMKEVQAEVIPTAQPAAAVAVTKTNDPTTAKGKGKDHYGRKFSKRQNAAMLQFTKTVWLQDAESSLSLLLSKPPAQKAFKEFLKAEYADAQVSPSPNLAASTTYPLPSHVPHRSEQVSP